MQGTQSILASFISISRSQMIARWPGPFLRSPVHSSRDQESGQAEHTRDRVTEPKLDSESKRQDDTLREFNGST